MFHIYGSDGQAKLPILQRNGRLNDPALYRPSKELMAAVNVALNLGLPLLLTGEPGTGKTQLAHHIAYFFELGKPLIFNAQTTSSAKDLFYRYDALGHFQYAQTQKEALKKADIESKFIHYQALGEAIRTQKTRVVLIDEIDKAPRDLPNDVLAAIDDLSFRVPEIEAEFTAADQARPIIIMTSNSEKNLPDAFLRRVIYHHIPFPKTDTLLKIISSKVGGYSDEQLGHVLAFFEKIRSGKRVKLRKNPATAELIQWTNLLHKLDFPVEKLSKMGNLSEKEEETLRQTYSVLAKSRDDLKEMDKL